jgi:peptide/nickel transport system substrate-binding protein
VIKQQTPGYFAISQVDAKNMKKIDPLTVQIPMKTAYPLFPEFCCSLYQNLMIVPVGYNPARPVGTGPFRYQSFTPGQSSTFTRNPNYWRSGRPYVDTLVVTDYSDETSQVNGLLSNQVDCVNLLSDASLPRLKQSGGRAVIAHTGCNTPFTMRTNAAPFNDVRVRQAFRLMVDRPQMNTIVWGGHATIANDLFSPYDSDFNHSIPQREQDIPQAKALLKAAGHENLSVNLVTADIFSGVVSSAEVFAQQAAAAGVKVNLQQITPTEFFGPNYLKWAFAPDFWYYTPYLAQVAQEMLPTAPFNDTSWNDPHYTSLFNQAFTTSNNSLRSEIVHEMQVIDHASGGLIIPLFTATIDGVAARVQGVQPSKTGFSFGNYNFEDVWLT